MNTAFELALALAYGAGDVADDLWQRHAIVTDTAVFIDLAVIRNGDFLDRCAAAYKAFKQIRRPIWISYFHKGDGDWTAVRRYLSIPEKLGLIYPDLKRLPFFGRRFYFQLYAKGKS